jgi:hypothetical protein
MVKIFKWLKLLKLTIASIKFDSFVRENGITQKWMHDEGTFTQIYVILSFNRVIITLYWYPQI